MASYWDEVKDILYDAVNSEFYTEEERDALIADAFSVFAGYSDDASTIPADFRYRSAHFYSPIDLAFWIEDGGIPQQSVFIHRFLNKRGEREYRSYVSPNS